MVNHTGFVPHNVYQPNMINGLTNKRYNYQYPLYAYGYRKQGYPSIDIVHPTTDISFNPNSTRLSGDGSINAGNRTKSAFRSIDGNSSFSCIRWFKTLFGFKTNGSCCTQ